MKKILIFCALCISLIVVGIHNASAATTPPPAVWVTPSDATPGAVIELNALVYNDTTQQATVTVTFTANNVVIATAPTLTIASKTAKTATAAWVLPSQITTVTAIVSSAVTTTKKDIPTLDGVIGTIIVGGTVLIPEESQVRGFASNVVSILEVFRLKQLDYFTVVKQKSQVALGNAAATDIGTLIIHPTPPAATSGTQPPTNVSSVHVLAYGTYAYAAAGKALFSHQALYYVVIILLVLFVVRFIFSFLL